MDAISQMDLPEDVDDVSADPDETAGRRKQPFRDLTLAEKRRVVFQRFGLGAKPGGIGLVGRNPIKSIIARELDVPGIAMITTPGLPTYAQACAQSQMGTGAVEAIRRKEYDARIDKHRAVPIGFVERLVLFFANHFSMSRHKDHHMGALIGQLERDVIRKNILGRFETMLIGVVRHPAMLTYLDSCSSVSQSVGPKSAYALANPGKNLGLNENLAREIMELYTVGTDGGYTEADVTALAKIITGWSWVRSQEAANGINGGSPANAGQFLFRAAWHEPGTIRHMGVDCPDEGMTQGIKVLQRLARHPKTAEHLAYKMCLHFLTDAPTPKMVGKLAKAYLDSKGSIRAMAIAMLNLRQSWTLPLKKFRTPYETYVAAFRVLGRRYNNEDAFNLDYSSLTFLGYEPWAFLTPDGFADEAFKWLNADALVVRMDVARQLANVYAKPHQWGYPTPAPRTAVQAADLVLAGWLSPASRNAILAAAASTTDPAGDQYQGLRNSYATLFMLPEFLRR